MIKKFLILLVIISISIPIVDAIPLSDKTGFKYTFPVKTDNQSFTIEATGNMDVSKIDFNKNEKSITFSLNSSIESNLLEIVIPKSLIGGDFKFYFDNNEIFPNFNSGKNTLFLTIEFFGIGEHELVIEGTTYLETFDVTEKINYELIGASINSIESNPSTGSLIFSLENPENDGKLLIQLSDDMLMPFQDNTFSVIIDGIASDYLAYDEILEIKFNSNTKKIIIMGSYVIPEFYEIAPLVLATSLIGLIILKKHKKLFA